MGFGLKITENIIQTDKKNWVDYEGIYVPKMVAAGKKAWETRKKNQEIKKYKSLPKDTQREIIFNFMFKALKEWKQYNLERYSTDHPSILLLETPELFAVKKLELMIKKRYNHLKDSANEYHPHTIIIPNDKQYFELHEKIGGGHIYSEYLHSFVEVFDTSYLDFIQGYHWKSMHHREYPKKFSLCLIWADYCGAFSSHTQDIEKTFESKLLGNHSYYAITFCKRDPQRDKKLKKYSMTNAIVAVNDFVSKTARKYGYEIELLPESSMYKSNMFSAIFLVKYKHIDKNLEQLTKLVNTYYDLQSDLKLKLREIDVLIKKEIT